MSVTLSPPAIGTAIPAIPALLGYRPQTGQLTVLHLAADDPDSWKVVGCHATHPGAPSDQTPAALAFMDAEADRLGHRLHGRLAVAWSHTAPPADLVAAAADRGYTLVQARHLPDRQVQWRYPGVPGDQWRPTNPHSSLLAELVHAGINTDPARSWADRFIGQWAHDPHWAATVADAAAHTDWPTTPDRVATVSDGTAAADRMWASITGPDRPVAAAAVLTSCTGPLWMRDLTMLRAAREWRAAEAPFAAAVSAAADDQVAPVASAAAFAAGHHGDVGLATRLSALATSANSQHSLSQLMSRWAAHSADPAVIRSLVSEMTPAKVLAPALTPTAAPTAGQAAGAAPTPPPAARDPKPGPRR